MKQDKNVQNLLELIKQNPNAEIVPMVNYEVVPGDEYTYWMGSWDNVSLDECYRHNERIYFRSDDEEELIDEEYDAFYGTDISDEEAMKQAEEKVKSYPWTKCICVIIGPL